MHFHRPNIAILHLEILQRRAAREIKNASVALDTHKLQPREVVGGEGPVLQHEGKPRLDGRLEPELLDLAPQRTVDPAVDAPLHSGDVIRAQI
jgi:hypothetical protein